MGRRRLHLGPRRPPVRDHLRPLLHRHGARTPTRPWSASATPSGRLPPGPFRPLPTPFICQPALGGRLDPRVFADADGTPSCCGSRTRTSAGPPRPPRCGRSRLTGDGLGLTGQPGLLLSPDEPWEGTIVEAPDMVEVDGALLVRLLGQLVQQPELRHRRGPLRRPAGPLCRPSPEPAARVQRPGLGTGRGVPVRRLGRGLDALQPVALARRPIPTSPDRWSSPGSASTAAGPTWPPAARRPPRPAPRWARPSWSAPAPVGRSAP